MNLYIIQVNASKIFSVTGKTPRGPATLKIHPVKAETAEDAINKLLEWYKTNRPKWHVEIVDSEPTIE